MTPIQIKCDRCGKIVDGFIDDVPSANIPSRMTSGFYDVSKGYWLRFARQNEKNICDFCMRTDSDYQELCRTE